MATITEIRNKFKSLSRIMDERARRAWAATEALAIGWGGISQVANATGIARNTIMLGIRELERKPGRPSTSEQKRIRQRGGGRKRLIDEKPGVLRELKRLVDSSTRGDPDSPLRWTCKSTKRLADELNEKGFAISDRTVASLLKAMEYSLQANEKTREGSSHPDRNAQFEYIGKQTRAFQRSGQPVISVDTKKKELIGDFKNAGREWRSKGDPEQVRVHDFLDKELGKGIPYGVYDLTANEGWVSVGNDHDTAEFATETIRRWWTKMGVRSYPKANELLIMADAGGSNSSRSRLWKLEIQRLSDKIGLRISVCHFPPGTSKWNKIEHRMFSYIAQNWRGRPLVSHEVMVKLIGNTTTSTGLKIKAAIDRGTYETGRKVTKQEFELLKIKPSQFRGNWNYTIEPRKS
jgi:hypothetical protein